MMQGNYFASADGHPAHTRAGRCTRYASLFIVYADSQSSAAMNSAVPVIGSIRTWSAEIVASASDDISRGQRTDLMRGGLSGAELQSTDRDELRPGDLRMIQYSLLIREPADLLLTTYRPHLWPV